jgi:hypothetical protein
MIGVIFALVIVLSAAFYYGRRRAGPERQHPPETTATTPPPAPLSPPPPKEESARPTPTPSAPPRNVAKPTPSGATPAPETTTSSRATVTIDSDVPGAAVFVNRQFVGNAPVTLENVEPGSKSINLSADGYDGVSRTLELTPGVQTVTMRFKEVRLDKRIPVVHKHGVGSCNGELVATVDGLKYVTSNAKDAGTVAFPALEQFEVNYLEKNLRVKQRGGRTWNFTDANDNADALFVFHRDVESARKKLAQGFAPVR